jgi:hypothetical protein
MLDFDPSTKTFSNLIDLYTDGARQVAWPALLPGGDWVVFALNDRADYGTWQSAHSKLAVLNRKTKTMAPLDQLNGMSNGQSYLLGAPDADLNYEPTVLPQTVGGYYWVVFTSRRRFGNTFVDPDQNNASRKKLWVSALQLSGGEFGGSDQAADLSAPAFYVEEQEPESGNMRAFWSLDACKPVGDVCKQGTDDCCGGYCRLDDASGQFKCNAKKIGCALENETCETDSDCCNGALCRGNKCVLTSNPK